MNLTAAMSILLRGRLSRRAYVLLWLLPTTALFVILEAMPVQRDTVEEALAWVYYALLALVLVGDIPLGMARFRDGGLSGWWYLLLGWPVLARMLLIALWTILAYITGNSLRLLEAQDRAAWVAATPGWPLPPHEIYTQLLLAVVATSAMWSLFRLAVRAGDVGPNKYGPDPLAKAAGV